MTTSATLRLAVLASLVGILPPALLLWLSFRLEEKAVRDDLAARATAVAQTAAALLRPSDRLLDAVSGATRDGCDARTRERLEAALDLGTDATGVTVFDDSLRLSCAVGASEEALSPELARLLQREGRLLASAGRGAILLARRFPAGFGIVRLDAGALARALAPLPGEPGRTAAVVGVAGPVLVLGRPDGGPERPSALVRLLGALLGSLPQEVRVAAPAGGFAVRAAASEDALLASWSATLPLLLLLGGTFGAASAGFVVGVAQPGDGLTHQLRAALRKGEFEVRYQPVVDVSDGRCVGAEALLRWRHERHGLLSPGLFIALAEETGLVVPITEWLMRRVARDLPDGLPDPAGFHVSINLAGTHLRNPRTAEVVARAFEGSLLGPSQLVFELTERELVEDAFGVTRKVIEELRAWGAKVALDDFGTGWSNMATLRRFRLDSLKLDKTFVDGIGTGSVAETVVDAMIDLGRRLEMTVVAEGVEREEQRDYLMARGVRLFQGYLFAEPLPLRELAAFARDRASAAERGDLAGSPGGASDAGPDRPGEDAVGPLTEEPHRGVPAERRRGESRRQQDERGDDVRPGRRAAGERGEGEHLADGPGDRQVRDQVHPQR